MEYIGALRLHRGYRVLVSLRHAGEVVSIDTLEAPKGRKLDAKELDMARRLIEMMASDFDPSASQPANNYLFGTATPLTLALLLGIGFVILMLTASYENVS